ncbi:MAG: GMC family oxidoreductase, partial [Burkholderiaceae bacterium]
EPNPQSRVSLSSERDPLGMPRVTVDWRLTDLDRRGFERTMSLVADELETQEIALVKRDEKVGPRSQREIEGTWHHMGTTRMHASPRSGVVDPQCRVHGIPNLYVAGASVFPTGGANHPTIQLLALAYRLADHLVERHDQDTVRVGGTPTQSGELASQAPAQALTGAPAPGQKVL